jgi:hypothetical protein
MAAKDYFVHSPENPLRAALYKAFEDANIYSVSITELLNHIWEVEMDDEEKPWQCANETGCSFLQTDNARDATPKPLRVHSHAQNLWGCPLTLPTCSQKCADVVLAACKDKNGSAWQCQDARECKYCR